MYKDHSMETGKVVFIDRGSSCSGSFIICFNHKPLSRETENVVCIDMWSLCTSDG